jgi:hypothetical protein
VVKNGEQSVSYVNGHGVFKKVTSTFDTQREAKLWAAKEEVKVKNGYDPEKSKMTFSNYYLEWFENIQRADRQNIIYEEISNICQEYRYYV